MSTSITEAPQIVGPIDWNLSDRKINLRLAAEFRQGEVEAFRDFPTATLMVKAGNAGGQIGLVSKRDGRLEYYVRFESGTHASLGTCATQIKLWRSQTASIQGLAKIGFNDILLHRYDTIVSDLEQTDRGREFWTVQISDNANTKTVGFLHGDDISVYDRSESVDDWIAGQDGWGKERRYRYRRFFISNLSRDAIEG